MRSPEKLVKVFRDDILYRLVSGRRGSRQIYRYLREHDVSLLKEIDGIRIVSHADKIGRSLANGVLWQREEFLAALKLLKKKSGVKSDGVFVDIGANIGTHSIYAAMSGAFSKVIAIEPLFENLTLAQVNLTLNKIDNVTLVHSAAGSEPGKAKIYRNVRNYGKSSLANDMGDGFEIISVSPLTDILKKENISLADVSMVWIDVEGFEAEVIKGMSELLECNAPLVIEVTPHYLGKDLDGLTDRLEANYTQCHTIIGSRIESIAFDQLRSLKTQVDILVI